MAANLKRFREKEKYTQEQLAELAGCSKNHLSALERGVKFPSASLIEKLSDILNVKPFELLRDEADTRQQQKKDIIIDYVMEKIDPEHLKKLTEDNN